MTIDIHKLLNRKEVAFDVAGARKYLFRARVLVTGAGGSIGSEVCRWLMGCAPGALIPVCKSEASLVNLLDRLESLDWIQPYIGDVTDASRMQFIFAETKPDLVIHCAAHKHVPLMEKDPGEAIKNNVFGTQVIASLCARYGAKMVLVSTDKASNPTSVMGATKRLAELCVLKTSNGHDGLCVARLINVIGSSGSVLEIWKRQLEAGERLTVTHRDMTRYFMTPREAAMMILKAASLAKGCERFVFDMDTPTKILTLAEDFRAMRLPAVPYEEPIITSIRPGEKIHEDSPCKGATLVSPGIRVHRLESKESVLSRLNRVVNDSPANIIEELQSCLPEYKTDLKVLNAV